MPSRGLAASELISPLGEVGTNCKKLRRDGADASGSDPVAGHAWIPRPQSVNGLISDRVDGVGQRHARRCEIAGTLRRGRHKGLHGLRLAPVPQALVCAEDENLVFDDRASAGSAELVLFQMQARASEKKFRAFIASLRRNSHAEPWN